MVNEEWMNVTYINVPLKLAVDSLFPRIIRRFYATDLFTFHSQSRPPNGPTILVDGTHRWPWILPTWATQNPKHRYVSRNDTRHFRLTQLETGWLVTFIDLDISATQYCIDFNHLTNRKCTLLLSFSSLSSPSPWGLLPRLAKQADRYQNIYYVPKIHLATIPHQHLHQIMLTSRRILPLF